MDEDAALLESLISEELRLETARRDFELEIHRCRDSIRKLDVRITAIRDRIEAMQRGQLTFDQYIHNEGVESRPH